jgi:hypothetical protein
MNGMLKRDYVRFASAIAGECYPLWLEGYKVSRDVKRVEMRPPVL